MNTILSFLRSVVEWDNRVVKVWSATRLRDWVKASVTTARERSSVMLLTLFSRKARAFLVALAKELMSYCNISIEWADNLPN